MHSLIDGLPGSAVVDLAKHFEKSVDRELAGGIPQDKEGHLGRYRHIETATAFHDIACNHIAHVGLKHQGVGRSIEQLHARKSLPE